VEEDLPTGLGGTGDSADLTTVTPVASRPKPGPLTTSMNRLAGRLVRPSREEFTKGRENVNY